MLRPRIAYEASSSNSICKLLLTVQDSPRVLQRAHGEPLVATLHLTLQKKELVHRVSRPLAMSLLHLQLPTRHARGDLPANVRRPAIAERLAECCSGRWTRHLGPDGITFTSKPKNAYEVCTTMLCVLGCTGTGKMSVFLRTSCRLITPETLGRPSGGRLWLARISPTRLPLHRRIHTTYKSCPQLVHGFHNGL